MVMAVKVSPVGPRADSDAEHRTRWNDDEGDDRGKGWIRVGHPGRSHCSHRLNGENDAIADAAVLQLDDSSGTQVEASTTRVNRRDDHVVADPALSHQHEVKVGQRMLSLGLGDRDIPLVTGVFGIANQSPSQSAGRRSEECAAARVSRLVACGTATRQSQQTTDREREWVALPAIPPETFSFQPGEGWDSRDSEPKNFPESAHP
jgi:hypothetical protein